MVLKRFCWASFQATSAVCFRDTPFHLCFRLKEIKVEKRTLKYKDCILLPVPKHISHNLLGRVVGMLSLSHLFVHSFSHSHILLGSSIAFHKLVSTFNNDRYRFPQLSTEAISIYVISVQSVISPSRL